MSVRSAIYGLEAAVLALLVALGVIDDATSAAIGVLGAAVVPFVTEAVKAGGVRAMVGSNPVRSAAYSLATAVLALLVKADVIDDATSTTIAAIGAVLLIGGTEAARSVVTPVSKMVREQRLS